jgi:hypothetical protein
MADIATIGTTGSFQWVSYSKKDKGYVAFTGQPKEYPFLGFKTVKQGVETFRTFRVDEVERLIHDITADKKAILSGLAKFENKANPVKQKATTETTVPEGMMLISKDDFAALIKSAVAEELGASAPTKAHKATPRTKKA